MKKIILSFSFVGLSLASSSSFAGLRCSYFWKDHYDQYLAQQRGIIFRITQFSHYNGVASEGLGPIFNDIMLRMDFLEPQQAFQLTQLSILANRSPAEIAQISQEIYNDWGRFIPHLQQLDLTKATVLSGLPGHEMTEILGQLMRKNVPDSSVSEIAKAMAINDLSAEAVLSIKQKIDAGLPAENEAFFRSKLLQISALTGVAPEQVILIYQNVLKNSPTASKAQKTQQIRVSLDRYMSLHPGKPMNPSQQLAWKWISIEDYGF